MKRRYFLWTATAIVGTVGLSHYVPRRARESLATTANPAFKIVKTEQEWRKILTPEQFRVLRQQGTERAGSSPLDQERGQGTFFCAGCELPLFTAKTKYSSTTGWPSFYAPIDGAVETTIDKSFAMTRVEVKCRRCGGHLGHVFEDGPKPTGKRYCINGVSLRFVPG